MMSKFIKVKKPSEYTSSVGATDIIVAEIIDEKSQTNRVINLYKPSNLNEVYDIIKGATIDNSVEELAKLFDINYNQILMLSLSAHKGLEKWQVLFYCVRVRSDNDFCNFCSIAFNVPSYQSELISLIVQTIIYNYQTPRMFPEDVFDLFKYITNVKADKRLCYAYEYCVNCVTPNIARIFIDAKITFEDYLKLTKLMDERELIVLVGICTANSLEGKLAVDFLETYIKRLKKAKEMYGIKDVKGETLFEKANNLEQLLSMTEGNDDEI